MSAQSLPGAELQLSLTLEESRLILEALVERPFKQVFEVIGKLNHQAQQFYSSAAAELDQRQLFFLTRDEFHCCVTALGDLPYNRVQPLLAQLHAQLLAQSASEQSNA